MNGNKCLKRLEQYLILYNKGIDIRKFTYDKIDNPIRRAKQRDIPPCVDWPRTVGSTTVYKLVEKLRRHEGFIP